MNVLFLSLLDFKSLSERNIYTDLLREFTKNGDKVYVISPVEKRYGKKTYIIKEENTEILKLKIGNIQKTNIIEKGISTLTIEKKVINGIKNYFSNIKFDLILYSTPPITFCKAIEYVKKRDNARTYLMLKDIFPQNAVDMGMLKTTGLKGILYKYFRDKEKKLYNISDTIGCMSQANVDYILKHNPTIEKEKVEICPNAIEVIDKSISEKERKIIREKYNLPLDKMIFIYGGNLGKPQGVPFIIECLKSQANNERMQFVVVGNGTDFNLLDNYVKESKQDNLLLMRNLPKDEYDKLVAACDIGMIFLDYRFTIPNFPSRILSYMQAKLPVLTCTDKNTDIGRIVNCNKFGWYTNSDSITKFIDIINEISNYDGKKIKKYGENGFEYLKKNYTSDCVMNIIKNKI